MMHDEYHAAKAEACAPAISAGAANLADAHDAYDGAQAWPDGGLDDIQLGMLAVWDLIDQLAANQ
jgi:hypothetical protein